MAKKEQLNPYGAQVIEAPLREFEPRKFSVFLAGGITNCPDWQSDLISKLQDISDLNILNPRRKNFPIHDPNAANAQIEWEFNFLEKCNIVSVWFSSGSLNPIVMYELGMWVNSRPNRPAFIGIDPNYERKQDVLIQTKLARPEIKIATSINGLAGQIRNYISLQTKF